MFEANPNLITEKVNISREYIEKHITQIEIMKHYLYGFRVEDWINTRDNFCSPIRIDNTPTCSLYTKGDRLYMKDWAGHFHGDCYNLVCWHNNLQYGDLMGAMKIIIKDMPNRFFGNIEVQNEYLRSLIADAEREQKRAKLIQIKRQEWQKEQVEYWSSYHIPLSLLAEYHVYSCEYMWLDGSLHYTYKKNDFAIAYYFGMGKAKYHRYKIYYPLRTKGASRFIGNSDAVQGYNQLPPTDDLLILTKSLKDVLILRLLGYSAVALQSEQHHFSKEAYEHLSKRFKKIIVFYDNDEAGRKGATRVCELYNLMYIEIPEDYDNCKDISDISKEYSLEIAGELMEELLEYII